MSKHILPEPNQTVMTRLSARDLAQLVGQRQDDGWTGALRIRRVRAFGSVWFVKGHVVHASIENGRQAIGGLKALAIIFAWDNCTLFIESNLLPPQRSIRISDKDFKEEFKRLQLRRTYKDDNATVQKQIVHRELETTFRKLKQQIPGLISISIAQGSRVNDTTLHDAGERSWIYGQLENHWGDDNDCVNRLFLEQDNRVLFIERKGVFATVFTARIGTPPEALFRAAEETSPLFAKVLNLPE
jgi:hypothetical protein